MSTTEVEIPTTYEVLSPIPGEDASITQYERAIFWVLHKAHGRMVSTSAIWNALYSHKPECDWPSEKIVQVFICKLRKKLKTHKITTTWGVGYSMEKVI